MCSLTRSYLLSYKGCHGDNWRDFNIDWILNNVRELLSIYYYIYSILENGKMSTVFTNNNKEIGGKGHEFHNLL